MSKLRIILTVTALGFLSAGVFFALRSDTFLFQEPLPEAKPYRETAQITVPPTSPLTQPAISPSTVTLAPTYTPPREANEINLAIPFTVQAPYANWDEIHQEFCEEASVLMAAHYILGKEIPNAEYADAQMFLIKAFEEQRFGYYKDTTAEETALILREYYKISAVDVVYDPTIAAVKSALAQGKTVIVPAAGRLLGNPYFTQPGPLYHMLVIKGFTKDGRFITNDPGTRRGADYLYDPQTVLNAAHDWNGGDVQNGRKVMIVVG